MDFHSGLQVFHIVREPETQNWCSRCQKAALNSGADPVVWNILAYDIWKKKHGRNLSVPPFRIEKWSGSGSGTNIFISLYGYNVTLLYLPVTYILLLRFIGHISL